MEDNSIDVTTTDDLSGNEDSFDMEEQIDQAIGILEEAKQDPDSVMACGLIVAFTPDTDVEDPDGESAEGRLWRVINPEGHTDYDNLLGVVEDVNAFDQMVDDMKITDDVREKASRSQTGAPSSLEDLLGL